MADEQILIEIKVDNEKAVESLNEQNAEISKLQKQNKELAKQGQKNSKRYQENAQKIRELNTARKQNVKLITAEKGSLNELRANLARLTKQRNELGDVNGANAKRFQELQKQIKQYSDSIKKAEEDGGDFRRSVGNYARGLGEATQGVGVLGTAFDGLSNILLASPIGMIAGALTGLFAILSKTKGGTEALEKATAFLNGAFGALTQLLAPLGDMFNKAFDDPIGLLEDFGNSFKEYVLDRVNNFVDGLGFLGSSVRKLFSGDFTGALEDAQNAGENFLKANPLTNAVIEGTEAIGDFVVEANELGQQYIQLARDTRELEKVRNQQIQSNAKLLKAEEELGQKAEDSTLSLQEQLRFTLLYQEAQQKRIQGEIALAEQETKLVQDTLNARRRAGQDTLEQEKMLSEALAHETEKRQELALSEQQTETIKRQHKSDQNELFLDVLEQSFERERDLISKRAEDETLDQKAREQALKDLDSQYETYYKNVQSYFNEYGVTDDQLTELVGLEGEALASAISENFEGLTEIQATRLREQVDLLKTSKQEQIEIEKATAQSIVDINNEAQEKIKEANKKTAQERVDNLNTGLGVAQSTTSSLMNLSSALAKEDEKNAEKNAKREKTFSIASALMNGAVGVTAVLTDPTSTFPQKLAQIGTVVATTGAQVANINKAYDNRKSGGGTSATSVASGGGGSNNDVNTSAVDQELAQQEALTQAISNLGLSVSVNEINDAQRNVSISQATSTI